MIELFKNIKIRLSKFYESNEAESLSYIILEEVLNVTRIELFTSNHNTSNEEIGKINSIVDQLEHYKPIQHILGYAMFYNLKFKVNNNVLIPRPETEELVHLFVEENKNSIGKLLDIGSGSGCIPISIKKNCPGLTVDSIDISRAALALANQNAFLHTCDVSFKEYDILNYKANDFLNYDYIISNPPYVLESEKSQMNDNVLNYEPHLALFVPDENPLIFYEKITAFAKNTLRKDGKLYLEINELFGPETEKILVKNGFCQTKCHKDFKGKTRFVTGIKDV